MEQTEICIKLEGTDLVSERVKHSAHVDVVAEYRVTSVHDVSTVLFAAWNEAFVSVYRSAESRGNSRGAAGGPVPNKLIAIAPTMPSLIVPRLRP